MAYYEQFTKKPVNKREDLRDDELTRRPARDGGRAVETERKSYKPRKEYGERREGYAPRKEYGERREGYAPRKEYGERREGYAPRKEYGERRDERPAFNGARPQRREERPAAAPAAPVQAPVIEEGESNLLVGRNPIREALRADRDIEKLLVARGELIGSAREIVAIAREKKIVVQEVARERLDQMAPNHQGLIAVASAYAYKTVDDMLALAKERGEAPLLVILDGVTDPHNLGAIIRSAECAGAHGVIIPERRAVGLTPSAVKASAGAVEYLPVAKEVNLTRTIERLKKEGIWVYGAAMNGEDYRKVNFSGAAAIVIGSEGEGMSRIVAESCDKIVSLPMKGHIDSLNASVAAGILLYAVAGARA